MPDWPHFSHAELACRCGCGRADMDPDFMQKLEAVRRMVDQPMAVSSAFRCPEHNQAVSSTGADGPHTTGRAIDIRVSGHQAHRVLAFALRHGMSGVGVKQHGNHSARFLHMDDLEDDETPGPRPWIWSYP